MCTTAQNRTILLVEDDTLVRTSIRQMLAADDYSVIEAGGGAEAMKIWRERSSEIGLLMTDIRMPGITGIDLVNSLMAGEHPVKTLLISGYPELLQDAGPMLQTTPFLQKPFTFEQVSGKLRAVLNRPLHGWKCPRCFGRRYLGLTAEHDGQSLVLTYRCVDCGLRRFTTIEQNDTFDRCPFCSGPVVPAGHSYVGEKGYNLGSACYTCRATLRTYTAECAVIPW
ncbi:MAG TPA: response regulator [Bryobacteraceae bacterium]|nr:response regulator [Bryobacteraceae bacterium]